MKSSSRHIITVAIFSFFSLALLGCGEDDGEHGVRADADSVDAGGADSGDVDPVDADPVDAGRADADPVDAGRADAGEGLPTTCEGACTEHAISVEIDGQTGDFERAFYGLTSPEASSSGQWEVYIEAFGGGESGCPQQDSPAPDWSLIVSGLVHPLDAATRTKADDGVAVIFFDFDGRFLGEEPFIRATSVSATPTAANVDTELVAEGQRDEDGLVALELQASFERGEVSGHLVATHCTSLDVTGP